MMNQRVIFILGVSGSGKTTIGQMLAGRMDLQFLDADDFHTPENVEKMRAGIPLTDADRAPWLRSLNQVAVTLAESIGGVIACSALKEAYRSVLSKGIGSYCTWVFLEGDQALIAKRLKQRHGHYMPAGLLASQFAILEIPRNAIRVSVDATPETIVQRIMKALSPRPVGIIGLGVMGRNLALNIAGKGFPVSLYNRHVPGSEENVARNFISKHTELKDACGFDDLRAFAESLPKPRRILLMIEAGRAVDDVLDEISQLLSPGDVIADCGNTHCRDTERRMEKCTTHGIHYVGTGISGGADGARHGPAIMAGGDAAGYILIEEILTAIAARDRDDTPCAAYCGPGGSGHYIKMVHNGIEYAEMQLIAEVYGILRHGQGLSPDEIARIFSGWNKGASAGYLLDITVDILRTRQGDGWLLDSISDVAGSKGTGAWSVQAADALAAAIA